jgi:hypothetical protein
MENESKILKTSSIILHHIGVGGIELGPKSITIKLRDKIFSEDLISRLKSECGDKIESTEEKVIIKKRDIPEIFDSLYEKIATEARAMYSKLSDAISVSSEASYVLSRMADIERRKINPSLLQDLSELIEKNKADSNLLIGLQNIAAYHNVDILHKAIKILKEVKYDVGRVAFYLGMNPGISPWDFVDLLDLVEINREDKDTLWEFCNDLDDGYPSPNIMHLKEKYGRNKK